MTRHFPRYTFFPLIIAAAFVFCAAALFTPSPVRAAPPQSFILSPLLLTEDGRALYVNFSLTVDDEDGLRDLLKDGAVAELSVEIQVDRKRSWWSNASVNTALYDFVLHHAPLTREFILTSPGLGDRNMLRDKNLTRLLHASWRKLHLEAVTLERLDEEPEDREYDVTVTVALRHKEVPPWLEKSFMFWSADIVPSESLTTVFQR